MSDQPINADVAAAAAGTNEPQTQNVNGGEGNGTTDGNPAWAELLGVVPSSLHPTITPYLQKWDKSAQDRITRVQSEYAPYKDFLGVDPQQITASMQLAELIAKDPRQFYDLMGQKYAAEWGLDQGLDDGTDSGDYSFDDEEEGEEGQEQDIAQNPLIQQLKSQQDTIAQFLYNQMQQDAEAKERQAVEAAGKEIETELSNVAQKFKVDSIPPEAEEMIISLALQNKDMTITQAADRVMPLFQQQSAPAARIVSPGGGVPAGGIDTRHMNSKDTRSLVENILRQQAAAQNQG